jgi:nucleoside-diphosphate-sugar epimerase
VARPARLVVTGASGFVGRHLLEAWKEDFLIHGIARRSQSRSGAPKHPNIAWHQVDIGDRDGLMRVFRDIAAAGGADACIHLAAHYDFTGEEHPEYWRTNVEGLRNVLDQCVSLGIPRFVFSSSLAACRFPPAGGALDESSAPDGFHVYSRTKAAGEGMLREYRDRMHSTIVRFAALFSDWCEYPPLFVLLSTWLSGAWNRKVLAGRGAFAIPFLHVWDVAPFLRALLDRFDRLEPEEILIASPDGAVSHRQLYESATLLYHGDEVPPLCVPKPVCAAGIAVRHFVGRFQHERPFERPWMARFIDRAMTIDGTRSRARLGWEPRERLSILRRMPFLVENLKTDPLEWHRKNRAALKEIRLRANLRIHALIERHEEGIARELTEWLSDPARGDRLPHYRAFGDEVHRWHHVLILRNLMNAIRTRERTVFMAYCADLARRRFESGFSAREVLEVFEALDRICVERLLQDADSKGLEASIRAYVSMTLRFGADQVEEVFDRLATRGRAEAGAG